jgi:hypothetical protein
MNGQRSGIYPLILIRPDLMTCFHLSSCGSTDGMLLNIKETCPLGAM